MTGISRVSISDTATTAAHNLSPTVFFIVQPVRNHGTVNYGAVQLFGVVSLMVGSNTGVPMSPGHGGCQVTAAKEYYTTSPPYYTTTSRYATSTNYAEAPKCYTTEYSAPAYYIEVPKYYTTTNAAPAYYTEAPTYFNTTAVEYYT
ncbi:uncharacterized protein LOC124315657 [Daphnia pulicaria]|uniref:uncharacterized protein LOC124315657 n=1 Tax=Daphnia pulicaria TaxID=35523 RepID=UPI001EECE0A0|nr:uncharacterized protein LOC124315657 [Daphnia pulicaria]